MKNLLLLVCLLFMPIALSACDASKNDMTTDVEKVEESLEAISPALSDEEFKIDFADVDSVLNAFPIQNFETAGDLEYGAEIELNRSLFILHATLQNAESSDYAQFLDDSGIHIMDESIYGMQGSVIIKDVYLLSCSVSNTNNYTITALCRYVLSEGLSTENVHPLEALVTIETPHGVTDITIYSAQTVIGSDAY